MANDAVGQERDRTDGSVDAADEASEIERLRAQVARLTSERDAALEQQAAAAEVLRVIASSSMDAQAALESILETAARLCDAPSGGIMQVREADGRLAPRATYGVIRGQQAEQFPRSVTAFHESPGVPATRDSFSGRVLLDGRTVHVHDMAEAAVSEFPANRDAQARYGYRAGIGVPLRGKDGPIGVLVLQRFEPEPFSEQQVALVEAFADQAVIAIENARLFQELRRATARSPKRWSSRPLRPKSCASSPPRQRISTRSSARSPRAPRGCARPTTSGSSAAKATDSSRSAAYGAWAVDVDLGDGLPINRGSLSGRSVIDGHTIHAPDLAAVSEDEFPEGRDLQRRFGQRTALSTPLLRGGEAIGTIGAFHLDVRPFTARHMALLETFADQAAIAIENARLFRSWSSATAT